MKLAHWLVFSICVTGYDVYSCKPQDEGTRSLERIIGPYQKPPADARARLRIDVLATINSPLYIQLVNRLKVKA